MPADEAPVPPQPTDKTPREKAKRTAVRRGLTGLGNDTKWKEFVGGMVQLVGRRGFGEKPRFRFKTLEGLVTHWDEDYPHHLPPTMIDVEWFDVEYLREMRDRRLPPTVTVIDYAPDIIRLLERVGLEFEVGKKHIRTFGYAPKDMELFDV